MPRYHRMLQQLREHSAVSVMLRHQQIKMKRWPSFCKLVYYSHQHRLVSQINPAVKNMGRGEQFRFVRFKKFCVSTMMDKPDSTSAHKPLKERDVFLVKYESGC